MKLINIDGPDGSGKSTLVNGLLNHYYFHGKKTEYVHFPRYDTELGKLIKSYLNKEVNIHPKAIQLLYSADRINFSKFEALELAKTVDMLFVDRYTTSGLVYGAAEGNFATNILANEVDVIEPDMTIILLAEPENLFSRLQATGKVLDRHETLETQKVALEKYKLTHCYVPNTVYIDAMQTQQTVLDTAIDAINKLLF